MKRSAVALLMLFLCSACSHYQLNVGKEEDQALSQLTKPDADARLAETLKELEKVDDGLRSAQARRDSFEMQASDDATRQNKVEIAEAELSALQTKKANLMHRQHVLEGRLRELGAGQEPAGY